MRSLLFTLMLLSTPAFAGPEPVDTPSKQKAPVKDKFPLPKDASAGEDAPGGGGKIQMFKVPRGRDIVVAEVKKSLETGGWKLTKESKSPSGNAIRLEVKKGDKLYKVSFTGDDSQTGIVLTLPG
jgi:hypothetical protein